MKNLWSGHRETRKGSLSAGLGQRSSVQIRPAPPNVKPKPVLQFLVWLKNKGYREASLQGYSDVFKHLEKSVSLNDTEAVKTFSANKKVSEARKQIYVEKYARYCEFTKLSFEKPIYRAVKKLPFVPTENEVDALIAGCGKKTACFLQMLKDTGARPGEAFALKWINIDFEHSFVTVNNPEKNSLPRTLRVSSKLLAMLKGLKKRNEYIFRDSPNSRLKRFSRNFYDSRIYMAKKLENPRLRSINLKTFRHWKASYEYHKTKDILHVKQLLGHVNIMNTLVYTNLVHFEDQSFVCKCAKNSDEAMLLIESGFEFVCDVEGVKLFRKPK
jgi:integrase